MGHTHGTLFCIKFDRFLGSRYFSFVSGNDVISCHTVFKFAYLVELKIGYQPAKLHAVNCLDQVLRKDLKNTIMTSLHISTKLKFSWLSGYVLQRSVKDTIKHHYDAL